jgi:glycerol-3-phosphate acyltransferase PlsY
MNDFASGLLLVALSYFVGSIPFGFLIGRIVGKIDIRQHGSGNIGATNVGRVLGNKWGMLVFVLDLAKGLVPVACLSRALIAPQFPNLPHWQVAAGIATILGHMFPCWLGFRGGKGVATALGVVTCLAPGPTVAAVLTFGLSFAIWRIVSLSSMLASIAFALCQIVLLWPAFFSREHWSLLAFSLLVPALILARHRSNILRILRGEEKTYRSGEQGPENHGRSP